ncbi:hypothetical protein EVAR_13411_1 [Eumeta japonica]|uniref:Uncharacterized protein n=1 Tax=Eumeta variegata TaxID=151549 RepID=A0A4C1V7J0_EUMVA|nr:hypothetical protein EVAR_13411_1 [Eumeta japonica]
MQDRNIYLIRERRRVLPLSKRAQGDSAGTAVMSWSALELFSLGQVLRTFHANKAHLQEIADSHIHQGARSVKTTNTTSLDRPLSCNGQRATKTLLRQPQITTDRHACQMSQTNHHQQHYPSSYRQASNNGDL